MRVSIQRPNSRVLFMILAMCATGAIPLQSQTSKTTVPERMAPRGCWYVKVIYVEEYFLPKLPKGFELDSTTIERPHVSETVLEGAGRIFPQLVSTAEVRQSTDPLFTPFWSSQQRPEYELACGTFGGLGDAGQQ